MFGYALAIKAAQQNRLGRNGWKPGWITGIEFTEIEGQEVA